MPREAKLGKVYRIAIERMARDSVLVQNSVYGVIFEKLNPRTMTELEKERVDVTITPPRILGMRSSGKSYLTTRSVDLRERKTAVTMATEKDCKLSL